MSVVCGRPFHVVVNFKHKNEGRYEDRLEILLEDLLIRQQFAIVRPLRAVVGSRAEYERLAPRTAYIPRKRTAREPETDITPGIPPEATSTTKWVTKLPPADIPKGLIKILLSSDSASEVAAAIRQVRLPARLDSESYSRHFRDLVWIEEFKMQ